MAAEAPAAAPEALNLVSPSLPRVATHLPIVRKRSAGAEIRHESPL